MNKDLKNKTIAEACGWRDVKPNPFAPNPPLCGFNDSQGKTEAANNGSPWGIPDYLGDLNACAEFEKTLTPKQSEEYVSIMDDVLGIPSAFYGTARRAYLVMHANAQQRAECFLRVKGLWVDTP